VTKTEPGKSEETCQSDHPVNHLAYNGANIVEDGSLDAVVGLNIGANVGIDLVALCSKAEYVLPKSLAT
jgi:hypothetical protein